MIQNPFIEWKLSTCCVSISHHNPSRGSSPPPLPYSYPCYPIPKQLIVVFSLLLYLLIYSTVIPEKGRWLKGHQPSAGARRRPP